ncbi:glucosaminidase domain-containing protein (plasmid) [Rossellomorea sp. AcN35-11]|nr:glucosaminidase domain-containing protein [Rossellomorea aquimaris]WJV32071.1 glucosaminidase domain-containing protein [Rossellomorea sp. AcN35-11]
MKRISVILFVAFFAMLSVNSAYAATGWVKDGPITYYYLPDGNKAKGWHDIEGDRYYFYSTGGMATGWLELPGDRTYYLASDGSMQKGFQSINNQKYYFYSSGGLAKGWLKLPGDRTYYLNGNGVVQTGQVVIEGKTYFFSPTGELVSSDITTGWVRDGSTTYYYKADGTLATGWQKISGKRYYFYSTGGMATGWLKLPGDRTFYFNSDGTMVTGFKTINNQKYYFYSTGGLAEGWLNLPGDRTYYLNNNGVVVTKDITLGGKEYSFFSDGYLKSVTSYTEYPSSVGGMVSTNTNLSTPAQTDKYRYESAYVHKDYVDQDPKDSTRGTVNTYVLNVRMGPSTDYWKVGKVKEGEVLRIRGEQGDWYEIDFTTWRNALPEDVAYYVDPSNFDADERYKFQFLNLSENTKIPADALNEKILANKGILQGEGQAFVEAAFQHDVNELYLISHALLETGNGQSTLANGVLVQEVDGKPVEPKIAYNMYGTGAYDSCALTCGSEYAYKKGWFTPAAAIIGGAEYIGEKYINHATYQQDTLYKMRWNPDRPGVHQYATDIGWAAKQTWNISNMYGLVDRYTLHFDIPKYQTK